MVNKDFDYIIHPTLDESNNLRTYNNGQFSSTVEEIEANGLGLADVEFGGVKRIMAYATLYDGKIIMLTIPRSEVFEEISMTSIIIVGVIFISAILSTILAFISGRKISEPIVLATDILNTTANLDLQEVEETNKIKSILNRKYCWKY